jgi:hypothetical protein
LEDKGNKMNKSAPVFFAIIIALWSVTSSIAGVELYAARKVVLGTYNSSGLGTHNMPWSYVHNHEISVDDQHQTYVLDRNAKRILMFATDGKFIKDIYLNNVDFNDRSETEGDDGYIAYSLKVTGDGKKFYLTEGGNETNWSIVDSSGTPIRKNISRKYYWLERIGHTNNFRSEPDNAVINEDLNVIKLIKYKAEKNSLTTVDTADNLYITKRAQKAGVKVVIEKVTAEGMGIAVGGVMAVYLTYTFSISISIWKSASQYNGKKTWSVLAKVYAVLMYGVFLWPVVSHVIPLSINPNIQQTAAPVRR